MLPASQSLGGSSTCLQLLHEAFQISNWVWPRSDSAFKCYICWDSKWVCFCTHLLRVKSQLFTALWLSWVQAQLVFKTRYFGGSPSQGRTHGVGRVNGAWTSCCLRRLVWLWYPFSLWITMPRVWVLTGLHLCPSYSPCCGSFFRSFVVENLFFCSVGHCKGSYSLSSYIFCVPLEWNELRIFLICHLDLNSLVILLKFLVELPSEANWPWSFIYGNF